MAEEIKNNRREFLKKSGMVVGFGLMLPVLPSFLSSCSSNSTGPTEITVKISDYPGLSVNGTPVFVSQSGFNSGSPVIVTRVSSSVFTIYSAKCTHEGATVNLPSGSTIRCSQHGAVFSAADGSVISGPANSPLQKFNGTYDSVNNTLLISV